MDLSSLSVGAVEESEGVGDAMNDADFAVAMVHWHPKYVVALGGLNQRMNLAVTAEAEKQNQHIQLAAFDAANGAAYLPDAAFFGGDPGQALELQSLLQTLTLGFPNVSSND